MGYAIKSACDLVLTNLANSEDTTTIDFLNSFNERKFLEFKYKLPVKPIISIVAEVTQDFDSTEMLGYLISDEYGNLDLYTSDMLIKNLDKFYLMNYSKCRISQIFCLDFDVVANN